MKANQQNSRAAEQQTRGISPPAIRNICCSAALLFCCSLLPGCLERTITITSTPPDAIVWLNDVEVGRTPVTTGFIFYGDYDVRLRHEGFEPLVTHKQAVAPVYEYAPIDLGPTAWPGRVRTDLVWHFDLTPSPDPKAGEQGLVQRAKELRDQTAKPGG